MSERLCRHKICSCDLPPDRAYCDPHCADADREQRSLEQCPCGHSTCRPENARAHDPHRDGPIEPSDVRNE
jgi:hypothetical protein